MDEPGLSYDRIRAVVRGELRGLARRKTPFALRTLYAALVALGVLAPGWALFQLTDAGGLSGESMAQLGAGLFFYVVVVQVTLAAILGVLLGVASIASERRNKTLGLLVLSQLTGQEIVYGKLAAVLVLVLTVLLAGLPVFALLGWVGGVDYYWLLLLGLYTPVVAALGASAGLYFGLRFESVVAAGAAALGALAIPVLLVAASEPTAGCFGLLGWLVASPARGIVAVAEQGRSAGSDAVFFGQGISLLFFTVLSRASVVVVPQAASAAPGQGLRGVFERLDAFFEEINAGGIRFELGGDGAPRGNPVAWLTRTSSGIGLVRYGLRVMVGALVILLALVLFNLDNTRTGLVTGFWILAGIGVPLIVGATAFGDEKARKTLGVLLATPLTAGAILRGKVSVFLRLLLMLALPTFIFLNLMAQIDPSAGETLILVTITLLGEAFLVYALALFYSVVLASPLRAGVATVAVLVVVHAFFLVSSQGVAIEGGAWLWAGAAAAAVWATWKRRPGFGLTVFVAILAWALGLLELRGLREIFSAKDPEATLTVGIPKVLALALFVFAYTVFAFDRALGRTR